MNFQHPKKEEVKSHPWVLPHQSDNKGVKKFHRVPNLSQKLPPIETIDVWVTWRTFFRFYFIQVQGQTISNRFPFRLTLLILFDLIDLI